MTCELRYGRNHMIHVHLDVGDANDDVLELVVFPGVGGTLDHSESSIILGQRCQHRRPGDM